MNKKEILKELEKQIAICAANDVAINNAIQRMKKKEEMIVLKEKNEKNYDDLIGLQNKINPLVK